MIFQSDEYLMNYVYGFLGFGAIYSGGLGILSKKLCPFELFQTAWCHITEDCGSYMFSYSFM
jgi:hypothetical protein